MTSPFAEYELTAIPFAELRCSMAVGSRLVLDPAQRTYVSRRRSDTIFVEGSPALFALGWSGTQNHSVACHDGVWCVDDLSHLNGVRVNGARLTPSTRPRALRHLDRVEPADGLVFTFVLRGDREPLAGERADRPAVLDGEPRVLMDWLLERAPLTLDDAHRALQHFRYRRAQTGTL